MLLPGHYYEMRQSVMSGVHAHILTELIFILLIGIHTLKYQNEKGITILHSLFVLLYHLQTASKMSFSKLPNTWIYIFLNY